MNGSKTGWRRIGIEPMMFLYMFAFMVTSVVEDSFFVYKACRADFGYSEDVCRNISQPEYKNINEIVQKKTSTFYQWNNIANHVVPVILSLFLGAWSDQVGRKLPILIGITGNLYYSSMVVLISNMETWKLNTVIWLASFPCALTGSNLTVFMAAYSYLADTTSTKQRTIRTTLVEVAYLLPMPLGVALGSYLFYNVVDQSYPWMFAVSASFHASAMLTVWILLDWKTNSVPRGSSGIFNISRVTESLEAIFKRRKGGRRCFILLSLLAMMLYGFQRDEKPMFFLYAQYEFNWDVAEFSAFKTYETSFFVAGLLIGAPILVKVFKLRDTLIIMIGALSHVTARILFIFGDSPKWLYGGAVTSCFGPVVACVIRSSVSKVIPPSDTGKIFALLTITDTAVPLVSSPIYSQLYNAVIGTHPEYIFYIALVTQLGVFFIGLILTVKFSRKQLEAALEEDKESYQEATIAC